MRVLVFENNLFWSSRLTKSIASFGHEVRLIPPGVDWPADSDAAIVNLGAAEYEPAALVAELKASGIWTIGHAGHKETDLRELGKAAGCDRIASNSEITFKLKSLLEEAPEPRK
jgi:hypothetical protein